MHKAIHKTHQKVHKHLKLRHHKHTGKLLHHRHTSYRGIGVVLALAGITMLAATWVQRVAASELVSVGGTVTAPVPSGSAIITTPATGTTVTSSDNLIAGTCPIATPQVAVVLAVDDQIVGSAMCDGNNDFALPVQLTPGEHSIVAQTHTVTMGRGTDSQPVRISYRAPHGASTDTSALLAATPKTPFATLAGGVTAVWNGVITGGVVPYDVLIAWGDGTTNQYTVANADEQYFSHQYKTPNQSYNARIAVADANGHSLQYQYATVAYTTATPASIATTNTPIITPTIAGLYGLFLTVSSVAVIAWIEARHAAQQEALAA